MKRLIVATMATAIALPTLAVDCIGVPDSVKMGEYSAQEAYSIVHIAGKDYRLGHHSSSVTKISVSLAQTALVSEKKLKLRFYNVASCQAASTDRKTPNSVQLLKD